MLKTGKKKSAVVSWLDQVCSWVHRHSTSSLVTIPLGMRQQKLVAFIEAMKKENHRVALQVGSILKLLGC